MSNPISLSDQNVLETILDNNDFPIYVETNDITRIFNNINSAYWRKITDILPYTCTFCDGAAEYYNTQCDMHSCQSCVSDILTGEIDVFNAGDHKLSQYLCKFICNSIDMNYWHPEEISSYFNDYNVTHNICSICHKIIENAPNTNITGYPNDYIGISGDCDRVAHAQCAETHGFNYYLSVDEYSDIFDRCKLDIDDIISDLNDIPHNIPTISSNDKSILHTVMMNFNIIDNIDYMAIIELFTHMNIKNWSLWHRYESCSFCHDGGNNYNDLLQLIACAKCLNIITTHGIDTINPVSKYIKRDIDIKISEKYNLVLGINFLFDECGLLHDTCNKCGWIIDRDTNVIITDDFIAHDHCIGWIKSDRIPKTSDKQVLDRVRETELMGLNAICDNNLS